MDDLYDKLVCALTHDISVCTDCKKCGIIGSEIRMNLVRELSKLMNKELPWNENKGEE